MVASAFFPLGSYVEPYQLTIRHSDLCHWMEIHHPDHNPGFYSSQV